ncbi:hypothetical protein GF339_12210, partial [candidate division KSB3 bacterium]|nr:hypothetical protein [candidate division KSB3 bacterium]MBD3325344.1 hypothetical protein [candidate division KSB3 bacterium]
MRKINIVLLVGLGLLIPMLLHAQSQAPNPAETFPTSLHNTRVGKAHFYSKETGGFEQLTNVPMDDLQCMQCHPKTYADGTEVDVSQYEPSCKDCHDFSQGTAVSQEQCLKCHSRQAAEIMKMKLPDVHRDKGL